MGSYVTRCMDEEDKGVGRNITEVTFHGVHSGIKEMPARVRLIH